MLLGLFSSTTLRRKHTCTCAFFLTKSLPFQYCVTNLKILRCANTFEYKTGEHSTHKDNNIM